MYFAFFYCNYNHIVFQLMFFNYFYVLHSSDITTVQAYAEIIKKKTFAYTFLLVNLLLEFVCCCNNYKIFHV